MKEHIEEKSGGTILTTLYDPTGIIIYKCLEDNCYQILTAEQLRKLPKFLNKTTYKQLSQVNEMLVKEAEYRGYKKYGQKNCGLCLKKKGFAQRINR